MNRKLLVNELLGWSDLNENENETIVSHVERQFKEYSGVKRKKTLPKKQRLKQKEAKEKATDTTDINTDSLK